MSADHSSRLLPVRDQGRRGTCLAFATTAVHEHARYRRRGNASDPLCVELLFWRAKQVDGIPGDGTTFTAASDVLTADGHCDEPRWPYDDARDSSAATYAPPAAALADDAQRRCTMTSIVPDTATVGAALEAGHTVIAGVELWDGFYDCDSSTLLAPAGDIDAGAFHAVCLVGVDDDLGIKVRNSWGTAWGEDGYAWMPIDALDEILHEAWTIDDDLDSDDV